MPFMIGPAPIRRTLKYLNSGKIVFRDSVKIFTINFNTKGDHHSGAREFVFWYLPQIQYKNPTVQCTVFKNYTPSPFIKIFTGNGESTLIDIDSRSKEEILNHLENFSFVCLTRDELKRTSQILDKKKYYSAYFGYECEKHCMCEVLGQVPCTGVVPAPKIWRGQPIKDSPYNIPPYYYIKSKETNVKS